jgi:mersacidin/lichenicidin family type 2 lantibiotic
MEITKEVILKAWKSEEYRESLPESARKEIPAQPTAVDAQIPARPTRADGTELSGADLEEAAGGGPILAGALIVGGAGLVGYGIGKGVNALTD